MAVTYEEALASVLSFVRTRGVREVVLPDAVGEVLAREVLPTGTFLPSRALRWTGSPSSGRGRRRKDHTGSRER